MTGKDKKKLMDNFIWGLLCIVLLGLSAASVMRSLIIGLDIDEQYAVTLAYRLARGDILVKEMWEPHQTSAILPALFTKIYLMIFGSSTYLLLYLRLVGTVMQAGVSVFWYRVMKERYGAKISMLTALIIFHTMPKWIQTPEFANMQLWFFILTFLCLLMYTRTGKAGYCLTAGVFMVLEVLAYPSCILIFPLYVVFLWKAGTGEEKRADKKGMLLFAGTCIGCAAIFVGYLLAHMSVAEIGRCMGYIMSDAEHSQGLWEKLAVYGKEAFEVLLYIAVYAAIALVIAFPVSQLKGVKWSFLDIFSALLLIVSSIDQIRMWAAGSVSNVHPQIRYLLLFLIGGIFYQKADKEKRREWRPLFLLGWVASVLAFAAVLLFTNLDMKASFVHLLPGMLCTFLFWADREKEAGAPENGTRGVTVLLLFWALILIGARGYLVRASAGMPENAFMVKQKALYGAAKNVYCSYMVGYQYNCEYEFLQDRMAEGDKVLLIGYNTLTYLMGDWEICTASTISTPVYDENYVAYYDMNPEKMPDVIVIERDYWENNMSKIQAMRTWILENYDWESKEESEYLLVVRAGQE